jgi:hypothetical protein
MRSVEMDQTNSIENTTGGPEGTGANEERRTGRKLKLKVDVLRTLSDSELNQVGGAWIRPPITWSCPQPSASGCCGHLA